MPPRSADSIFIPGCIFSDPVEADDAAAEEVIFFVEDIDFDNDFDFNDHDNDTAAAATLSGSKAKRQTL